MILIYFLLQTIVIVLSLFFLKDSDIWIIVLLALIVLTLFIIGIRSII